MNNIARGTLFLAGLALAAASFAASPEYLVGTTLSTPAPGLRGSAATASEGTDFDPVSTTNIVSASVSRTFLRFMDSTRGRVVRR